MIVRSAHFEDTERLLEMGKKMHDEGAYAFLPFDSEKVRELMIRIMSEPANWCGLVAESDGTLAGMLGGYLTDYFFCREKLACDLLLYVEPKWRRSSAATRLIRGFEDWAAARGARELCLGVSTGVQTDSTERFYCKLGFTRVGGIYKLRLAEETS